MKREERRVRREGNLPLPYFSHYDYTTTRRRDKLSRRERERSSVGTIESIGRISMAPSSDNRHTLSITQHNIHNEGRREREERGKRESARKGERERESTPP